MTLRNWLGHPIEPHDIVYRGAREGNSSSFRVGIVLAVGPRKVRVRWCVEQGSSYMRGLVGPIQSPEPWHRLDLVGTCDVDTLVHVDTVRMDSAVLRAIHEVEDGLQ